MCGMSDVPENKEKHLKLVLAIEWSLSSNTQKSMNV